MVLIVESGSTKADWKLINEDTVQDSFITEGLNPFSNKNSYSVIAQTADKFSDSAMIHEVYFYGAGVVGDEVINNIKKSFEKLKDATIHVHDDLLGAARAVCGTKPGVVCILGTGSNIGLFDGDDIIKKVASGGYLLGGEGSGMALGKEVLIMLLRDQLCQESMDLIKLEHGIDQSNLTKEVYSQSVPNRYLASFAPIVHKLKKEEKEIITNSVFSKFFETRIKKLEASQEYPIHFVGSIALSFQNEIEHMMKMNNLELGKVVDKPIHNLVQYHLRTN